MDKLERLLNLTAALLATERALTAEELRDRIGGYPESKVAFRRTFERDKDDLRGMGVPIQVQAIAGTDPPVDGYRIYKADYSGTDIRLDPDELAALHLATNLVRLDGGDTGLMKLGGDTAAVDTAPTTVGRVPFDDLLAALIGAAAERQAVAFRYGDTDRVVEPWRLSFSRGHWYLAGWDRVREAERLYRVDRIEGAVTPGGEASQPVGSVEAVDLRGWELGDGDPVVAHVLIDAVQASFARHLVADIEEQEDGSVIAELHVRNPEAFRSFVISFLDHAEVLDPPELRSDMISWLEALV